MAMPTRWYTAIGCILILSLMTGCESADAPVSYEVATVWGEHGSEPGQFDEPIGIALAGDEVFVSDAQNNRIQVFDREGAFLRMFGADVGAEGLGRPMHLTIHDDALYVPDFMADRIYVFSLDGELLREIGSSGLGEGAFDAPGSVAVDAEGRLYVAEFYGHRVQLLEADGTFVRQWGTPGEPGMEPGTFMYPTDVAGLADQGFVVGDAYNHRLQAFDAEGESRWMQPAGDPAEGSEEGQFNVATSVTVGPEGHIFVVDFYNHRIQQFDADGSFIQAFGEEGTDPGQFERPTGAAFDEDGYLYVVDHGNNRVQKFAPSTR